MPSPRKLVFDGAERLSRGLQPDRARQDAETLLLHILGKDKAWLLAYWEEELSDGQVVSYSQLLERRGNGEPIQYITGLTEFYSLPFRVNPKVLIPRPETEHLVEKAIELALTFKSPRVIDIGTGSGAIAVALACHLPEAAITAIDISAQALELARHNASRNGVSDRIRFLEGDLLEAVAEERFDIVVSNLPYVSEVDRALLSVEVRDHEPALALFAGEDGLDVYRRLIPGAFDALISGGFLLLEIGYGQSGSITGLLEDSGFERIEFIPDLQSIDRVACARRPKPSLNHADPLL